MSGENCDLLHCPLVYLSFGVGVWICRFRDYNIFFSDRLSVRWAWRVESYVGSENCDLLHCPLVYLSFQVGVWIRRFRDYNISFSAHLSSLGAGK